MRPRSVWTRARLAAAGVALSAALLVSACSGAGGESLVTVTHNVTATPTAGASATGSVVGKPSTGRPSATTPGKPTTGKPGTQATAASSGAAPGALPDGFVPTKLKAGQKAPQFIVVSFDGVGWHEKWQYWFGIMKQVPFHFTGFLSGTYMLSSDTKMKYQGPGHNPGKSSISWNAPSDLPLEIADLNQAIAAGNEIGTHFNGHFCAGSGSSGNDWNTDDWNNELDQFFGMVKNVNANNNLPSSVKLNLDPSEVKGERTPCLEGHQADLFPALKAHGLTYDSTFTRRGITWPTKSSDNGIWQMGMPEFPIHGTSHFQIAMDYNFYYTQENGVSNGVSPSQSAADGTQVRATYQDMYNATYNGNRAPLMLGNHFNAWNNNVYSDALGDFVLSNCGKPDTYCVPFRDVIAWMNVQDPARLAQLQAQGPELQAG